MIKSFLDKESEDFYITGKSRKIPSTIHKLHRKLDDFKIQPALNIEFYKKSNIELSLNLKMKMLMM